MKRSRLLLYILLAVLVPAGAWLFGVSVRGASQDHGVGGDPQPPAGAAQRVLHLEVLVRDLIDRHPDFELAEARRLLQDLQSLPAAARDSSIDALEARLQAVEAQLRREAIGPEEPLSPPGDVQSRHFKTFSPNGFGQLYERVAGRGVTAPTSAPAITADPAADRRIVEMAVARGYRLRGEAQAEVLEWEGRHALQPEAFAAWRALRAAARSDGLELDLVSAYRSVDRQREIFLAVLERAGVESRGAGPSPAELASGRADDLIEAVLRESSPPGFSRHHTGYALDITDAASGRDFTEFGLTEGFAWISDRNYLNAKRFGFIPSYPEGASGQGPDPEPWEYVWVGPEVLAR